MLTLCLICLTDSVLSFGVSPGCRTVHLLCSLLSLVMVIKRMQSAYGLCQKHLRTRGGKSSLLYQPELGDETATLSHPDSSAATATGDNSSPLWFHLHLASSFFFLKSSLYPYPSSLPSVKCKLHMCCERTESFTGAVAVG